MLQRWGLSHPGLRSWKCTAAQEQRTSLPFQGPKNKKETMTIYVGIIPRKKMCDNYNAVLELEMF